MQRHGEYLLSQGRHGSLLQVVRAKAKLRAFAFSPLPAAAGRPAQVTLALANNMLEASCPPLKSSVYSAA